MAEGKNDALLNPDLWALTSQYLRPELIDTIGRSHVLLDKVMSTNRFGARKSQNGKRGQANVMARANNDIVFMRSFYDPIKWSTGRYIEQLEWGWKLCYKNFFIAMGELLLNRSAKISDLMTMHHNALAQGYKNIFANQLYAAGSNNRDEELAGQEFSGLQYCISANPYATGLRVFQLNRGGMPGDKYEFWRNWAGEFTQDSATATANGIPYFSYDDDDITNGKKIHDAMIKMVQRCTSQADYGIDCILINERLFNMVETYINSQIKQVNNRRDFYTDDFFHVNLADGTPVYLDYNCPRNAIFFLDSSTFEVVALEGANFKTSSVKIPNQLDTMGFIMWFMGNMIMPKVRCNGIITIQQTTCGLPIDANVCTGKTKNFDYLEPAPLKQGTDTTVLREGFSDIGIQRNDPVDIDTSINGLLEKLIKSGLVKGSDIPPMNGIFGDELDNGAPTIPNNPDGSNGGGGAAAKKGKKKTIQELIAEAARMREINRKAPPKGSRFADVEALDLDKMKKDGENSRDAVMSAFSKIFPNMPATELEVRVDAFLIGKQKKETIKNVNNPKVYNAGVPDDKKTEPAADADKKDPDKK